MCERVSGYMRLADVDRIDPSSIFIVIIYVEWHCQHESPLIKMMNENVSTSLTITSEWNFRVLKSKRMARARARARARRTLRMYQSTKDFPFFDRRKQGDVIVLAGAILKCTNHLFLNYEQHFESGQSLTRKERVGATAKMAFQSVGWHNSH